MKALPLTFSKNGFQYVQLDRNDQAALYIQYDGQKAVHYEVFKIRYSSDKTIGGRHYPPAEKVPNDAEFGKSAWSIPYKDQAYEKFKSLSYDAEDRSD